MSENILPRSYREIIASNYGAFKSCFINSNDPWFIRMANWLRYRGKSKIISNRAGDDPYLERFYLFSLRPFLRIVIHCFWRSDDDGGLHDHPWRFAGSKILKGGYHEHLENKPKVWCDEKTPLRWFNGTYLHRVELKNEDERVWTLFIMGPKYRRWGFVPFNGKGEWVYWRDYIAEKRAKIKK